MTITLLDRYILKKLLDYLFLGVVVFTLLLLFSNALLDFMKDLEHYGISWDIAFTLVGLQVPRIVVLVIPMSALLSTLMVYSNLSNQFELIAMRMSGISLYRLAMPAVILGIGASICTYILSDYVAPTCHRYSWALKTYAVNQQNLPSVHENFIYKQFDKDEQLKRLIYISHFHHKHLGYSTLIDLTNPETLQVTQARSGLWGRSAIELDDANVYTVSFNQKLSNTTRAEHLELQHFIQPQGLVKENRPRDLSFIGLWNWMEAEKKLKHAISPQTVVTLWEKLTFPLSALPLVLISVPLSISAPRKLGNIGFLMAIVILFCYYLLRHISTQIGYDGFISPLWSAVLPLIVITAVALMMFRKKNRIL